MAPTHADTRNETVRMEDVSGTSGALWTERRCLYLLNCPRRSVIGTAYGPENKSQSMECRHKNSRNLKKNSKSSPPRKTWCWPSFKNARASPTHIFLRTVILSTPIRLSQLCRNCIRLSKRVILQHDNARSLASRQTVVVFECLKFHNILPHPSYSPDMAPCDFFLSPKLKERL